MNLFTNPPTLKSTQTIPPLPCGQDSKLLRNPDRGLRHQMDFFVKKNPEQPAVGALMNQAEALVWSHIDYFAGAHPTLSQSYIYLTDYRDTETLPPEALDQVRAILNAHRKFGIRALLRFAYQDEMDGSGEASEAVMTAHMQQLFPIVAEYLDVIHVYQAGFLGAWGEWHSNKLPVDKKRLLENMLKACPESLFIQMRLPNFKNLIEKDNPGYGRLSFHNDSLFGEYCTASGGVDPGTEQTLQVERESPYLPIDGELFWGSWSTNAKAGGYFPDPFLVATWLYEQRYTSLSVMHNYMELGPTKPLAMRLWQNVEMPVPFLEENSMPCEKEYFTGPDGKPVGRSAFDYIRDHLGYRLAAQTLDIQGSLVSGGSADLCLTVKNYGFAAPHMLKEAGFVLLDEQGSLCSECAIGSIADWYNRNPVDLTDRALLTHTAAGRLSLPDRAGRYFLGFYAKNNAGQGAALANDLYVEDGVNILGQIVLH